MRERDGPEVPKLRIRQKGVTLQQIVAVSGVEIPDPGAQGREGAALNVDYDNKGPDPDPWPLGPRLVNFLENPKPVFRFPCFRS